MTVCDSKRGCGTGGGMDLRGRKENEEPGEEGRGWRCGSLFLASVYCSLIVWCGIRWSVDLG